MSDIKLIKFRLRPKKKQAWLEWTEELKRRKEETLTTLQDEGVLTEACFLSSDGKYVYYLMEAVDLKKAKKISDKSIHPIDEKHREKLDSSLQFVEVLPRLFYFTRKRG